MRKIYQLITMAILILGIGSCQKDDVLSPDVLGSTYRYEGEISASNDDLIMVLTQNKDNVSIVSIENNIQWLKAEDGGIIKNKVAIKLSLVTIYDNQYVTDSLSIKLSDGTAVRLVVGQIPLYVPDGTNDYEWDSFEKDWESKQSIPILKMETDNDVEHIKKVYVNLPWNTDSKSINMPEEMAEDVRSKNGWVMAFNLFRPTANSSETHRYFGLYNKYTGLVRVFYYLPEGLTSKGEPMFSVTPAKKGSKKYPFYHALQYGIPVNHSGVQNKGNIFRTEGDGQSTFAHFVTPYSYTEKNTLKAGWYAFDINMQCYLPGQTTWHETTDNITLSCQSFENSAITLLGEINATTEGKYTGASNSSTSSNSGINYANDLNNGTSALGEAFTSLLAGDYLKAAFKGVCGLKSVGSAMLGKSVDESTTKEKSQGTFSSEFTGKISLTGKSVVASNTTVKPVTFSNNLFIDNDYVGFGIWSLKEDPVFYIVNDKIIGDTRRFNAPISTKNSYDISGGYPRNYHLRLISFIDPNTIKVNINTKPFKNVTNVNVMWYWGAYPNQPPQHSDVYWRTLMDISRVAPTLVDHTIYKTGLYSSSVVAANQMSYVNLSAKDGDPKNPTTKLGSSASTPQRYFQKGANYSYYGSLASDVKMYVDSTEYFVVDPQISFPAKDHTLYDPEVPDVVLNVLLTFDFIDDAGIERKGVFSKRFLPIVKTISYADAKAKFLTGDINTYYNNSKNNQSIQTTDNGCVVKHADGYKMLERLKKLFKNL